MKNLLLLLLAGVVVYQYMHPKVVEVQKEVRIMVPTARAQGPRLYFHSPLDAPAMPVGMYTGTGYFSADPNSRFTNALLASSSRPSSNYTIPRVPVSNSDGVNPLQSVEALQAKLAEQP